MLRAFVESIKTPIRFPSAHRIAKAPIEEVSEVKRLSEKTGRQRTRTSPPASPFQSGRGQLLVPGGGLCGC